MQCLPRKHALLSPCHHPPILSARHQHCPLITTDFLSHTSNLIKCARRSCRLLTQGHRSISFGKDEEDEDKDWTPNSASDHSWRFEEAVKLFNEREYYACHDVLESLWYDSNDPLRTLLHALLQCAVAFHHLFNQNHKGAMMELGEGVCKLKKLNLESGPFHRFEQEISAVLNFIYRTQLELAACNEDFCIAMGQTERSYQLLEGFVAGQRLCFLEEANEDDISCTYILFDPQISYGGKGVPPTRAKLPTLQATSDRLMAWESY